MITAEYIRSIEGHQLYKNSWSDFGKRQTNLFMEKYPFLETSYIDFLTDIGGVEVYSKDFILVCYGFALTETELIYPIDQYLRDGQFLAIGEYVEKRENDKWKGIGYFYCSSDKSPIIYTRFFQEKSKEFASQYFPTFFGFTEFFISSTTKSYAEQLTLATGTKPAGIDSPAKK